MFCPTIPLSVLAVSTITAGNGVGVTLSGCEVLPFQFTSPLYTAVTDWANALRKVMVPVATPFDTGAEARNLPLL
jgi:hypothetical protein